MTHLNIRSFSKFAAVLCLTMMFALAAAGQEAAPPPPPPGPDGGPMMHGPGGPAGFGEGKTVIGIPLTAQMIITRENTLADGNHISRTTQTTLYRDSQGRVRQEMTVDAGTPATGAVKHTFITITDPVSGKRYTLDPANKTARQMPFRPHGHGEHANGPHGPEIDTMKSALSKSVQRDQLGTKNIDGFQTTGERVTRTIAPGEIGNEKPIEVVTERWVTADLQLPLLFVHTDPLMGTATTKVTNVTRGEPDASLFQVPSDYKLITGRPGEPFYVPLQP
jgi:hypothetical protein